MEDKLLIRGGKPISGVVSISGGKNPAVAIIPATLLCQGKCTIENLPNIEDVRVLVEILQYLGAETSYNGATLTVDATHVNRWDVPVDMVRKMRASSYFIGILLGRFGKAEIAMPGGCQIGVRPMDQHIKGLTALGADFQCVDDMYRCTADHGLHGTEIYLDVVSVGATINIMLAAVMASGSTTIVNAAKEPHVVDLANFLSAMGANVKGAGTDVIRISGGRPLRGCTYSILPDQIETGTWMAIAAATGGDLTIVNCVPFHMEAASAKLQEMGIRVIEGEDYLRVIGSARPNCVQIKTFPYPGFPTDLQQPFGVLLSVASGTSVIIENIFEDRFRHVPQLIKMGADIQVNNRIAIIKGVNKLHGAAISATDLRAGAALVIAGLIAEGETIVDHVKYIDRGYDHLEKKLYELGADIHRFSE